MGAMPAILSSIADNASIFYRGRASASAIADTLRMENSAWRARLEAALKERGLSKREVSLRSKNGAGYVHSILSEGKDPTIENLKSVCDAIPVSLIYILFGFEVTPEDEAIVASLHEGPEVRDAVLTLLRQRQAS